MSLPKQTCKDWETLTHVGRYQHKQSRIKKKKKSRIMNSQISMRPKETKKVLKTDFREMEIYILSKNSE